MNKAAAAAVAVMEEEWIFCEYASDVSFSGEKKRLEGLLLLLRTPFGMRAAAE